MQNNQNKPSNMPVAQNVPKPQNNYQSNYVSPEQIVVLENNFRANMQKYQKSIISLLQGKYGIGKDEFLVSAFQAVKKNPKLLLCNAESLFGAILLSAEMKLKFNTPENHAYIIPYGSEANFQIGYQGLVELMYRNSRVRRVIAEAVFEKDEFRYSLGLTPDLHHVPYMGSDGRGELVAAYCVVQLKDADPIFTVVGKKELDEVRNLSKAKDKKDSPYNSGTDVHHWMEIKVAIKKIAKMIPKTEDLEFIAKAVEADSRLEVGGRLSVPMPKSEDDIVTAEDIKIIDAPQKSISEKVYGTSFDVKEDARNEEKPESAIKPQQQEWDNGDNQANDNVENNTNSEQVNEASRRGRPPKNPQLTLDND
jgi:recombination protein RecT